VQSVRAMQAASSSELHGGGGWRISPSGAHVLNAPIGVPTSWIAMQSSWSEHSYAPNALQLPPITGPDGAMPQHSWNVVPAYTARQRGVAWHADSASPSHAA
jgi:hypothetical protein